MFLFIFPATFVYYYIMGYRITPLHAARKHFAFDTSSSLVCTIDFGWITVFVYKTGKDQYLNIFVEKHGLLYRSSTAIPQATSRDEQLNMISISNYTSNRNACTFLVAQSHDEEVAFIEAGPPSDRIRGQPSENQLIVLKWNSYINIDHLDPVALSTNGNILYRYRSDIGKWRHSEHMA